MSSSNEPRNLSVKELKGILKNRGLSTNGNKKDLKIRFTNSVNERYNNNNGGNNISIPSSSELYSIADAKSFSKVSSDDESSSKASSRPHTTSPSPKKQRVTSKKATSKKSTNKKATAKTSPEKESPKKESPKKAISKKVPVKKLPVKKSPKKSPKKSSKKSPKKSINTSNSNSPNNRSPLKTSPLKARREDDNTFLIDGLGIYIRKILKKSNPNISITHEAVDFVQILASCIGKRLMNNTFDALLIMHPSGLSRSQQYFLLTYHIAISSTSILLNNKHDLKNNAIKAATTAVNSYHISKLPKIKRSTNQSRSGSSPKSIRSPRRDAPRDNIKAGLEISPSLIKRKLIKEILDNRNLGFIFSNKPSQNLHSDIKPTKDFIIALTAVLEYIIFEITDIASIHTTDVAHKKRITKEHIKSAIDNDGDLRPLFDGCIDE